LSECCQFFTDNMKEFPKAAAYIRERLCHGDFEDCNRYKIYTELGQETTFPLLYTSDEEAVLKAASCLAKQREGVTARVGKGENQMLQLSPIGIIRTPYATKEDAPIQGRFTSDNTGTVEVFGDFADGLQDVTLFSHLILLYHFDQAGAVELVRRPFLDDTPHGIFATRHPCRPNGVGITVVELLGQEGNILHVAGIDVLDKTPLIDIKPYVPRFDAFPAASEGWFAGKENRKKPEGRE